MPIPAVGARVRVPVGTRILTGCIVEYPSDAPGELKDVIEVLDQEPLLPADVVALCRWVADYYLAGVGDAIGAAMPPGAKRKATSFKTMRVATLTTLGSDTASGGETQGLTAKQRQALDVLSGSSTGLPLSELRDRGISTDVVGRLAARGLVLLRAEATERDPFERAAMADVKPSESRVLTAEQIAAFEQLAALVDTRDFRVALLHGVTGSGKTEIYLRLADRVRKAGRQTLLMVPEIALTPSVAALFRGAFGERVAIQHSGLSDGERHDQWHRIRRGDVDVVVGTRSAVFAPLTRVGVIVVDEEHDTSYKQEEAPRYHGRDVAIVRGREEKALVVLGSATPSMESYQHALSGKYAKATLERRVLDRPLASVRLVNMREEYADQGPEVVISRALASAIEERLQRHEQVLVLLNRRGYSTAVFCRQCGDSFECPNCTISLTVHTGPSGVAGAVSLLQLLDDGAEDMPEVRGAISRTRWLRHREGRTASARPVSGGAHRQNRSRLGSTERRSRLAALPLRCRRTRRAGRDADDRQGARLPSGHARRCHLGRRRTRRGRLPCRRAHVPTAHAGGGSCGPW
jgi:primosomal protein N' (replication factor Y)